ncbi:MAG: hypothetical protein Ta2A_09080 [Treponemataceae bacterium]|nr:MAG: hypothetical protein Ta2A_09080 [Treponemataceae bacterium]
MKKSLVLFFLILLLISCKKTDNTKDSFDNENSDDNELMYVNSSEGLRVRAEPNIDSEKIYLLNNNQGVTILKKDVNNVQIDGINGNWYLVQADEITGWVFSGYLSNDYNYDEVTIEYNIKVSYPFYGDDDMIGNVKIIYKPETDTIQNIDEIEPNNIVIEILDKPIVNKDIGMPFIYGNKKIFYDFEEITTILNKKIDPVEKNKIKASNSETINKVTIDNINFYLFGSIFLFIMEYSENNSLYDFVLKIGMNKDEIVGMLGEPSYYSDKRNIFIYSSHKTSRRMILYFDNDKLSKVQLFSFRDI